MSALCSCAPCWILALAGLNSGTGVDLGISEARRMYPLIRDHMRNDRSARPVCP
jgi:hypothetical protein